MLAAMTHPPVLSPSLTEKLAMLGARLGRLSQDQELAAVLAELSLLPASAIVRAAREIETAARLGWWQRPETRTPKTGQELMRDNPAYAWLFLFHPNGYRREAALDAIQTPPASAFFLAALAWRLNDWVPSVRQAAARCAARVLQRAPTDIAANGAIYLLDRRVVWGRWRDEANNLDPLFARADVMAALASYLQDQQTGPAASRLVHALRFPAMDAHLLQLATAAKQPSVRALAYRTLISGQTAWTVGFDWVWVDKSFNKRRRLPRLATRAVSRPLPLADLIRQAAQDKSAMVRKVAADGLIAIRPELENADKLIALFAADASPAVRARADYLMRHPA